MGLGNMEQGAFVIGLSVTFSTEKKSELLESVPQGPTTAVDSSGFLLAVLWPGLGFSEFVRGLFFKNPVRAWESFIWLHLEQVRIQAEIRLEPQLILDTICSTCTGTFSVQQ
jgi:hypothetical protein